jgi:hypothetical protein
MTERKSYALKPLAKTFAFTLASKILHAAAEGESDNPTVATQAIRRVAGVLEEEIHAAEDPAHLSDGHTLSGRIMDAFLNRAGERRQDEEPGARGASNGRITRAMALEMFDLDEGATPEQIEEAYSRVIRRVHPDVGGSNFFSKQANVAREILLGKRRA